MRLFEFIMESRSADLYHGTNFDNAENILSTDVLHGFGSGAGTNADMHRRASKHDGAASLSRDIRISATFGQDVIFVIDQNLLSRDVGKRLAPVADLDYNSGKGPNQATEYEEILWGGADNFSKYVKKIYILTHSENPEDFKFEPDRYPRVFGNDKSVIALDRTNDEDRKLSGKPKELMTATDYMQIVDKKPTIKSTAQVTTQHTEDKILSNAMKSDTLDNDKGILDAIRYAKRYKRGRWKELEDIIVDKPVQAATYANYLLKRRWPAAEPYIMKHPDAAYDYAKDVIKGRWPEAEPNIKRGWQWNSYKNYFKF